MTKTELRAQIKTAIAHLKPSDKGNASLFVCLQIIGTAEWQQAETVLLYTALSDEIDLSLLIQDAEGSGKNVILPMPTADAPTIADDVLQRVDLAIIPGRAFTTDGDRMGRGKGYYDRLLAHLHCPKWGAAFKCQIFQQIPTDPWDVKLDKIFV